MPQAAQPLMAATAAFNVETDTSPLLMVYELRGGCCSAEASRQTRVSGLVKLTAPTALGEAVAMSIAELGTVAVAEAVDDAVPFECPERRRCCVSVITLPGPAIG